MVNELTSSAETELVAVLPAIVSPHRGTAPLSSQIVCRAESTAWKDFRPTSSCSWRTYTNMCDWLGGLWPLDASSSTQVRLRAVCRDVLALHQLRGDLVGIEDNGHELAGGVGAAAIGVGLAGSRRSGRRSAPSAS